jgi:hypothetical protein
MAYSKKKNAPLDVPAIEMPLAASDPSIEITGGTISGIFCNYAYAHKVSEHTTNKANITSQVPAHNDLKEAFKKLNPHLAIICEEVDANAVPDIDDLPAMKEDTEDKDQDPLALKLSKFTVIDFKVSGEGDNAGITLTGYKRLSTGDEVKLTTPKIKWLSEYLFINELRIVSDDLCQEIDLYRRGKQAPRMVQTDMFSEGSGDLDNENA